MLTKIGPHRLHRIATLALVSVTLASTCALSACTYASRALGSANTGATPASSPIPSAALDSAAAALLPSSIKSKGVLRVGTDPSFAPYEVYGSDSKTVVGYDADLAKAIGSTLGVKTTMVPATFDTILPGISSGKYDLGMSGFSITPEREKNAEFLAYLDSGSTLAVAPGNPLHLSMSPVTLCGHTVSGQKGTNQGIQILPTFSKKCTAAGKRPINIQLFPTQNEANLALISGRVDAGMSGSISLAYQQQLVANKFELAKGADYQPIPTGIALPKNSPLAPAITAALKQIVRGNTYRAINAKWSIPAKDTVTAAEVGAH